MVKKRQRNYLTECKRAKLDSVFCNCSLEKIVEKYTSFKEAMMNEEDFPEILIANGKIIPVSYKKSLVKPKANNYTKKHVCKSPIIITALRIVFPN